MPELFQVAYLALLGCILVALLVGWLTDNVPAVVNAVASLALALSPIAVEYGLQVGAELEVTLGQELPLWLAFAGALHMLGMLGWYDSVWWWDHLTHTVSATLLAALIYASLHAIDSYVPDADFSFVYIAVFTVAATLAAGVFWEFIELAAREIGEQIDHPPVLRHYGLRDTAFDLIFNGVGAVLVVALDVRTFVPIAAQSPRIAELLLVGSVIGILVGTVLLGALLNLGRRSSRTDG